MVFFIFRRAQHVPVNTNNVSGRVKKPPSQSERLMSICQAAAAQREGREEKGGKEIFARLLPLPFLSSCQQIVFDI